MTYLGFLAIKWPCSIEKQTEITMPVWCITMSESHPSASLWLDDVWSTDPF